MVTKKQYIAPAVDVVTLDADRLLTASFTYQRVDSDTIDDPEEIL